jgi:hypothetical protein
MNPIDCVYRAKGVFEGTTKDPPEPSTLLTFDCSTRRTSRALFLFLMLGLAVFLWGISYKLSLYRSEVAQRAIPAAKLLSQKERPSSNLNCKDSCLLTGRFRALARRTFRSRIMPSRLILAASFRIGRNNCWKLLLPTEHRSLATSGTVVPELRLSPRDSRADRPGEVPRDFA